MMWAVVTLNVIDIQGLVYQIQDETLTTASGNLCTSSTKDKQSWPFCMNDAGPASAQLHHDGYGWAQKMQWRRHCRPIWTGKIQPVFASACMRVEHDL